jgi:hypothetical protein
MPAASESALALAGQLRSLTDEDLAQLIAVREVREHGIRDFFDLADALLNPESVQRALSRLDRHVLIALADDGPAVDAAALARARALALVLDDGEVPAIVRDALPDLDQAPPAALAPVSRTDPAFTDRVAADHAFTTTAAVAELVGELQREPARELAKGGIALPDTKRLAQATGVELDAVPALVGIAERAGLVAIDGGRWMPTASASDWLLSGMGERWAHLAGAWLERLPDDIRTVLGERSGATWGDRLLDYVDWLFPLGGDWMRDRVAVYSRDAELLGITAGNVPSTPARTLLAQPLPGAAPSKNPVAAASMSALFPAPVDKVYLQHDLSIVSPGPLATHLDVRLRVLADAEGRALASTYRVSAASLTRALALGETEAGLREFLRGISLTGIPQPLDYLLRETATRFGLVRVRVHGTGAHVHSTDATILRTLAVDQSLAALGLSPDEHGLRSRFSRDVVFWTLADHRYPVAAEDDRGAIVVLRRHRATSRSEPASVPASALVERLRVGSTEPGDDDRAWLARQLDLAIRGKVPLTVTVALPTGESVDYQLEPASIAGGRLRARDRHADIERTLPLGSITGIRPAE